MSIEELKEIISINLPTNGVGSITAEKLREVLNTLADELSNGSNSDLNLIATGSGEPNLLGDDNNGPLLYIDVNNGKIYSIRDEAGNFDWEAIPLKSEVSSDNSSGQVVTGIDEPTIQGSSQDGPSLYVDVNSGKIYGFKEDDQEWKEIPLLENLPPVQVATGIDEPTIQGSSQNGPSFYVDVNSGKAYGFKEDDQEWKEIPLLENLPPVQVATGIDEPTIQGSSQNGPSLYVDVNSGKIYGFKEDDQEWKEVPLLENLTSNNNGGGESGSGSITQVGISDGEPEFPSIDDNNITSEDPLLHLDVGNGELYMWNGNDWKKVILEGRIENVSYGVGFPDSRNLEDESTKSTPVLYVDTDTGKVYGWTSNSESGEGEWLELAFKESRDTVSYGTGSPGGRNYEDNIQDIREPYIYVDLETGALYGWNDRIKDFSKSSLSDTSIEVGNNEPGGRDTAEEFGSIEAPYIFINTDTGIIYGWNETEERWIPAGSSGGVKGEGATFPIAAGTTAPTQSSSASGPHFYVDYSTGIPYAWNNSTETWQQIALSIAADPRFEAASTIQADTITQNTSVIPLNFDPSNPSRSIGFEGNTVQLLSLRFDTTTVFDLATFQIRKVSSGAAYQNASSLEDITNWIGGSNSIGGSTYASPNTTDFWDLRITVAFIPSWTSDGNAVLKVNNI